MVLLIKIGRVKFFMNKIIGLFLIVFVFFGFSDVYKASFIAIEDGNVIQQEGDCHARHSPCSTFKIALSLMGYDDKILIDQSTPELPFQQGYADTLENWKQAHTPALWMKHSCIWYSRMITKQLGMRRFQDYVTQFNYGNMDISGDKNKDNGLTHAWLSSSLEISPIEQIIFLQKLIKNQLPVSMYAHEMTKDILFLEELGNGWKLYAKTGSGSLLNEDRTEKIELQIGWFVGWMQKGNRTIVFAQFLEDDAQQDTYASIRAKALAKVKLQHIITGQ